MTRLTELLRRATSRRGLPGATPPPLPPPPSPEPDTDAEAVRGGFDAEFYLAANPDVLGTGIDPVDHYCRFGWREGRDPSPSFSTRFYLAANPDVVASGINPFRHYLRDGAAEGRAPTAAAQAAATALEEELALIRPRFDADHYVAAHPEARAADPVRHFCEAGWRLGFDPGPGFSTRHYLDVNPDVAAAGVNPFAHYLRSGEAEGRPPLPVPPEVAEAPLRAEIEAIRPHFDAAFYLASHGDVAESGQDPVRHYCVTGWREGRDPAPGFSTSYYLGSSPDVVAADVNPFAHWLMAGREEGRLPRHPGGNRYDRLRRREEVEARAPVAATPPPDLLDAPAVEARIEAARGAADRLLLSLSHDDHRRVSGGIQLCVQTEERMAPGHGTLYLNLNPWEPLPHPRSDAADYPVRLVLAGEDAGVAPVSAVVAALSRLREGFGSVDVTIHHLMGHSAEAAGDLAVAAGGRCLMWLHDHLTLCPAYTLQRNDVAFCGAPAPGSDACRVCAHGDRRRAFLPRLAALFDRARVEPIACSAPALGFWRARGLIDATPRLLPHLAVEAEALEPWEGLEPVGRLRFGFAGTPADHKGWPDFVDLRARLGGPEAHDFTYFGARAPGAAMAHVPVHVTAADPEAMSDAIAAAGIDFVLQWCAWPETFSFATHEALRGGALVLTNPGSGNVAAVVRATGRGLVLGSLDEVVAMTRRGDLGRLAAARRRRPGGVALRPSGLSFEALGRAA